MQLYTIDSTFTEDLRLNVDSKVPITAGVKGRRPFLGVVIEVNCHKYYIPLTSPKPKHSNMRDSAAFMQIDSGRLGGLNINNMIPVIDKFLKKCDLAITAKDSYDDKRYKVLLQNQKEWCNKNINAATIKDKAEYLYNLIANADAEVRKLKNKNINPQNLVKLIKRCCNYIKLEEYISSHYSK